MLNSTVQDLWSKLLNADEDGASDIQSNRKCGNIQKTKRESTTVVFCGDAKSGKSSLIQTYLKPTAYSTTTTTKDPKPTIALEYNFAKQKMNDDLENILPSSSNDYYYSDSNNNSEGLVSAISHIWELGGELLDHHSLLDVPVNKHTIETTSFVICCDLSVPQNVIHSLHKWLRVIKDLIKRVTQSKSVEHGIDFTTLADNNAATNLYASHIHDSTRCQPCQVPLCIVITKYDLFKSRSGTERRALTQAIRLLAHYHGASIITTSATEPSMKDNYRATLNQLCFPRGKRGLTTSIVGAELNADRPLRVVAGTDDFESALLASVTAKALDDPNGWKTRLVSSEGEAASFLTARGIASDVWTRIDDHVSN